MNPRRHEAGQYLSRFVQNSSAHDKKSLGYLSSTREKLALSLYLYIVMRIPSLGCRRHAYCFAILIIILLERSDRWLHK